MPTRVCDRTPCDRLSKFFERVPVRLHTDVVDLFVHDKSGESMKVEMDYCPFCGTRFGEDVTVLSVSPEG